MQTSYQLYNKSGNDGFRDGVCRYYFGPRKGAFFYFAGMNAGSLHQLLSYRSNAINAEAMEAYMKNHFQFFGIKSTERRELLSHFLKNQDPPDLTQLRTFVLQCWEYPEREMQYCALETAFRYRKTADSNSLMFYEQLITSKSWWDSVDFIAPKLVGDYLKKNPSEIASTTERWLQSGNLWLKRSALLFQLKYKETTDTALLVHCIESLANEKEFFIRKAIGWVLREYSKTDPSFVRKLTESTPLSPLSKREAMKWLNRHH